MKNPVLFLLLPFVTAGLLVLLLFPLIGGTQTSVLFGAGPFFLFSFFYFGPAGGRRGKFLRTLLWLHGGALLLLVAGLVRAARTGTPVSPLFFAVPSLTGLAALLAFLLLLFAPTDEEDDESDRR